MLRFLPGKGLACHCERRRLWIDIDLDPSHWIDIDLDPSHWIDIDLDFAWRHRASARGVARGGIHSSRASKGPAASQCARRGDSCGESVSHGPRLAHVLVLHGGLFFVYQG